MEGTRKKVRIKKRYIALLLLVSYIVLCQACMTLRSTPRETADFFGTSKTPYLDKTVQVSGHPLHYIQTGKEENPTLFFVHGSPGSWDAFKRYMADSLLLKKYRMIAIDRPGFGYSDFGRAEDLATQVKWITEFVKTIDNKKPLILVGHSMGGPVIVKMATQNPEWYQQLVVLSGAVDPKAEKTENWRYYIKKKPFRYLIPGSLRPANDELWWLKDDLVAMKPELEKVTSEVTIIHGDKDPLVPYSNVAFMRREFVNAKSVHVMTIKGANHFIPWEHYDEIRDALLKLK